MCYSAMIEQNIKILESRFSAIPVRQSWDEFQSARQIEGNQLPPLNERIFPGYFAPVVLVEKGQRIVRLMKYSIDPPEFVSDGKKYTSYNARRDNLASPFWSECYKKNHGLVLIKGFYEWVSVKDLIKAGQVSLEKIKLEFERQKSERKLRLRQAGKPYKPTKTELTEAIFRKVVIGFHPKDQQDLIVPVIFSRKTSHTGEAKYGFAVVTDDPPAEVLSAGHDRCPVFFDAATAEQWLKPHDFPSTQDLEALLKKKPDILLQHDIEAA